MTAFSRLPYTLLTCALLAGSGLAQAQTAMSPAKKELLQRAMALQKPAIENVGNALAGQTANQILQLMGQAFTRLPADKRDALAPDLQADVKKFYDDIAPTLRDRAVALAPSTVGLAIEEKFSEEELKVLVAWLESPVYHKFQAAAGDMLQSLGQKLVADTRPAIEPKLKALELALQTKLAAAGVAKAPTAASAPTKASTNKK